MKKLLIITLAILFVMELSAQVRPANKKQYEKFFKSTTYVVEDGNPFSFFNETIKSAMDKHWHITPVKYITFREFERMRTNENASFMILADIKQRNLKDVYEFINFVMGDAKRDFESMPDLGSVPLGYRHVDEENYLYKMGAFVKFMQTYAQEQATTPRIRLTNFFNVKDERLKTMELWVLEEELDQPVNTIEKIRRYYPHPVKITTREEIARAIAEDRPDVAFLHKIGPEDTSPDGTGKCWKFVMAAKDGRILYSSNHDLDPGTQDRLLVSDLEKMAR
jgi:hypothetical protein